MIAATLMLIGFGAMLQFAGCPTVNGIGTSILSLGMIASVSVIVISLAKRKRV